MCFLFKATCFARENKEVHRRSSLKAHLSAIGEYDESAETPGVPSKELPQRFRSESVETAGVPSKELSRPCMSACNEKVSKEKDAKKKSNMLASCIPSCVKKESRKSRINQSKQVRLLLFISIRNYF